MTNQLLYVMGSDIDYFYNVAKFLGPSEACLSSYDGMKVGGCVLNAACVASKLGSNVKAIDYLKKEDEGTKLIVSSLNKNNVDTSLIRYDDNVTNGSCLIMKKDDEKCIYVLEPKKPKLNDEATKEIAFNSKYIYSLIHILNQTFEDISLLYEAKKKGVKIFLDGESLYEDKNEVSDFMNLANGIFMNKKAKERLDKAYGKDALKEMFNRSLEFACITDGSKGTDLYLKDKVIHEDITKVNVVDSTGAGDSFAGCFVHFLDKGKEYKECLELASCLGAYACTKEGGLGGAITERELYEFRENEIR